MPDGSSRLFGGSDRYQFGHDPYVPVTAAKAVGLFIQQELQKKYRLKPKDTTRAQAGEVTPRDIAVELGVSYPQVKNALDKGGGVGPKFEEQFAKKFFGGDVTKLRSTAIAWCEKHAPAAMAESDNDWTETLSAVAKESARDFVNWVTKTDGIRLCVKQHADVTVGDLVRYRAEPARGGDANPDAVYLHIQQLRRGPIGATVATLTTGTKALEDDVAAAFDAGYTERKGSKPTKRKPK